MGKILLFVVPLICSSLLQLLFNAADIVVVGKFEGSDALAAVGSTSSLINLLVQLFIGLSVGANVVVARYIGGKKDREIRQTVHTSIAIAILSGIFVGLLGIIMAKRFLLWMGSPEDVLNLSSLYLRIYFVGMPANLVYNFGAAILRAKGDTKRPLYYLFLSGIINVLLNLFLVIVCKIGVAGVAIATVVAQGISALLIIICLCNEEGPVRLSLSSLKINKQCLKEIAIIGLPAGLQGSLFSLSNVVIQSSVNSFGRTIMAGNAAGQNIEAFVYTSMNAFSQAAMTFIGQNIGANKISRVKEILIKCIILVISVGAVVGNLVFLISEKLLTLYSSDGAVIGAGVNRLKFILILYFLCGLMDLMVGALRGVGYSVMPMAVSLIGACAFRIVWVATIFKAVGTIESLYISYPISWGITFMVHMLCWFVAARRRLARMNTIEMKIN